MSGDVGTHPERALPAAEATPPALAGGAPAPRSWRSSPIALVRACRPRQWVKNLLVVAAPGAAGVLGRPEVAEKLVATFLAFCALSSATYLVNDLLDREEDRLHPRKHLRPIAAGTLSPRLAVLAALALAAGGLALAAAVRPWLAAVAGAYLLLTASYTAWWRSVAVADLACIAGGFVLRALAGGVATDVTVSRWFLTVTSFGALFLVAGKRHAELRAATDGSGRAALEQYSRAYLQFVIGLSATVATTAYCLWAFQRSHHAHITWYELTVIPFVLWLLRYALLIDQGGRAAEAPEEIALADRFLLTMSAAWAGLFVAGVYVVG
jgi:decaprenyl-phosphate phosphoribosyltransferase